MEDELCPTVSPACGTAHLQLHHLLTGIKPIPQVSLMGLIRYQRKGTKKQAVHLHQGWKQGCWACQEQRHQFAQQCPSMGWQGRMSPGQLPTDSHSVGLVVRAVWVGTCAHVLGQCIPLQSLALQCCTVTHLPQVITQLLQVVTHLPQVNTGTQEQLSRAVGEGQVLREEAVQLAPVLGCPCQREAGSWQGARQGGESSPPASGTWHSPTAGPAWHAAMWDRGRALPHTITTLGAWQVGISIPACTGSRGQAGHSLPARLLNWVSMELGSLLLSASSRRRSDSSSSSSPGCCGSKRLLCSTTSLRCSRSCVTLQEPSTTVASGTGTEGWGHLL